MLAISREEAAGPGLYGVYGRHKRYVKALPPGRYRARCCCGEFRWRSDVGRPPRRGFEKIGGAFQALIALDLALDLRLRKNEAKRLGFGRKSMAGSKLRPSCSAS